MSHRSNLFEIGFEGDASYAINKLDGSFTLVDHHEERNMHRIKIKAAETMTGNDLLKLMMPLASITSFNEVIPTMNEIFIRVVKAQNLILKPEEHE
jgi:ABC-2 type transport system ATP-binding protein